MKWFDFLTKKTAQTITGLTKPQIIVLSKKEPIPAIQENIENLEAEKRPIKKPISRPARKDIISSIGLLCSLASLVSSYPLLWTMTP